MRATIPNDGTTVREEKIIKDWKSTKNGQAGLHCNLTVRLLRRV